MTADVDLAGVADAAGRPPRVTLATPGAVLTGTVGMPPAEPASTPPQPARRLHARVWAAWARKSIGVRMVTLFLGLLLAVQACSFLFIDAHIVRNARASIADELDVGERLLMRALEQSASHLSEGATAMASDNAVQTALATGQADTLASLLASSSERLGATASLLLDDQFQVIAASAAESELLHAVSIQLLKDGKSGYGTRIHLSQLFLLGDQPFLLALSPLRVRSPHAAWSSGWIVMAQRVDQRLINDLSELSGMAMSLQVRSKTGQPWSTAVSTLNREGRQAVEQAIGVSHARELRVHLGGVEYSARTVPLGRLELDGQSQVEAVLLRSVGDAVAPFRRLQIALVVLTLLSSVVFAVGSVLTARHVTTPLRRLAAAADRLGRGDYATPMVASERGDEIGELAQSFERMRVSVAAQQEEILRLAYWDGLTGLPNRVQFRNAVHEAIGAARIAGRTVAVVMLDLDRFKHVNDLLGYRFGDLLLKRVAERLSQQAVRSGDLVARLDGDEFAVLLANLEPATDLVLTRQVGQRIGLAFDGALTLEEQTVDISASIGMAVWPRHAADADVLLSRAEVAMYAAKRRSDGPMLYDAALDAANTQTLTLLSDLRHAIDHHELRMYLQPKLSLSTGRVVGAEALVRWLHPQRGMVPPTQFIPFAEQTGFIRTLTMWMFEEAARTSKLLAEGGVQLVVSVNLSTRDLLDPELPQKFDTLLTDHGMPAEAFCLEITESSIMDDPQRALATLERLNARGFRLSVDDFGTGYSSLTYLKRLPVHELKIDKSFVLGMEKDLANARIVRSTIDLAHGLGLSVVAEGIENGQVWDLLRELACDEAQGFHMGKPMPAHEFARWCRGWSTRQAALATPSGHADTSVTLH